MDGRALPIDLSSVSSLTELRYLVAEVLGAPSPDNVELLDESGERLENIDCIENLGDMKIQTFLFGVPESDEEDQQIPNATLEEVSDEGDEGAFDDQADIAKFFELKKLSGDAMSLEMAEQDATTRASSEQADSPSRSLPLHEAVNLGDYDAVTQLLADGVDVDMRDECGETALHRAAYHGRKDMVNALLGARADPNAADRKGKTPLRRAYDSKEVAEILLSAGADPNAADKNGTSVLHRSAEDNHVDVAELLLGASADPNLLSDDELTPLHSSAIFGRAEVAKLLLSARADIHMKGVAGNTALHFAAYGGHEAVGKVLLAGGADPSARNEDGESPLEHAMTGLDWTPAWLLECDS